MLEEDQDETRPVGRPHLDGSPAGQGVYIKRVSISLPEEYAEMLRMIGEGNRSQAVRKLIDEYLNREKREAPHSHASNGNGNGRMTLAVF